jgi:hypothetical protein
VIDRILADARARIARYTPAEAAEGGEDLLLVDVRYSSVVSLSRSAAPRRGSERRPGA